MSDTIIQFDKANKWYGNDFHVLRDIDLDVARGERIPRWARPSLVIREGRRTEQVMQLIAEDKDVAILVLAAGTEKEGPGPLVSSLAGKLSGSFPIPITIAKA